MTNCNYTFDSLLEDISFPESLKPAVKEKYKSIDFSKYEKHINDLMVRDNAEGNYQVLLAALENDTDHMAMLTLQLEAARRVYHSYETENISKRIYVDTFSCFTRFIQETYMKEHRYIFDRSWWTYRQINMSLFRLGLLEYEYRIQDDKHLIGIHIPSGARLNEKDILNSLKECLEFTAKHFPQFNDADLVCSSWLLSPRLKLVLPETANIIGFQNMFDIKEFYPDDKAYYQWVFMKDKDAPIYELPKETSLQRNIVNLLAQGVNLGAAFGVLKRDYLTSLK